MLIELSSFPLCSVLSSASTNIGNNHGKDKPFSSSSVHSCSPALSPCQKCALCWVLFESVVIKQTDSLKFIKTTNPAKCYINTHSLLNRLQSGFGTNPCMFLKEKGSNVNKIKNELIKQPIKSVQHKALLGHEASGSSGL